MLYSLELGLLLCCLLGAVALLAVLSKTSGLRLFTVTLLLAQCAALFLVLRGERNDAVVPGVQVARKNGEYATSSACRSCHPGEYASWHRSFHRSMTSAASSESVRAPWHHQELTWRGRNYRIFRKQEEFWVSLPDPDVAAELSRQARGAPSVERRVVMTTGSHHFQAYWVLGERGNEMWQFPFVYHFESKRFIPRHDAFLQPPDAKPYQARWNSNCIQCHAVAGKPQHDLTTDRFNTEAVELGIACEACHGPGSAHVRRHQNPAVRYASRWQRTPDPTSLNPEQLDSARASEVCGQCHAYFVPQNASEWWTSGFTNSFVPGDRLAESRLVLDYDRDRQRPEPLISASIESVFFSDGTIRVGGREYNGLLRSPCYERGKGEQKLSCLSCHQMHGAAPVDQLKPDSSPFQPCVSCHTEHAAKPERHTHHDPGSSGSNCYNCHMPFTTYALYKGIRSHRITSPNASLSTTHGTPNACNLCHLDKSLAWTAEHLQAWYGQAQPILSEDAAQISQTVLGLLRGDAATRVLSAYAMGSADAQHVSQNQWQARLLAELLDDPYAAVRFVAHRSLRSLPGFNDFAYDFIAAREERQKRGNMPIELSNANAPYPSMIDTSLIDRLLAMRDDTPISISE